MSDALVFPDTKSALFDLIDGTTHIGVVVHAFTWLPADDYGILKGPFPIAHIYGSGGHRGFVDRVDRRTIEVYAPGQQALEVLESITAAICGENIDTPSGFLDSIESDIVPDDVPYQSDTLNKAVATFLVTSRPL